MYSLLINQTALLPPALYHLLPAAVAEAVLEAVPQGEAPEEIRLRRGHAAAITVGGRNIPLPLVLSDGDMEALLLSFCAGSVYAHEETLHEGYLVLPGGIRIGVCGHAAVRGGRIVGVNGISSFCLRLPHPTPPHVGQELCQLFFQQKGAKGILLYAPPGVGKTTLLRGVAAGLAGGSEPLRVCVVDTRGELGAFFHDKSLMVDVLSGYPRGVGLGIAARSLSPQVMLCDEIGDLAEAKEIAAAFTGGVPLIASAHGESIRELLRRPALRLLHEAHCFGAYVGVRRAAGAFCYAYDITEWEQADVLF